MALFLQTGIHHEGICSIVYSEEGLYINNMSNPAPRAIDRSKEWQPDRKRGIQRQPMIDDDDDDDDNDDDDDEDHPIESRIHARKQFD